MTQRFVYVGRINTGDELDLRRVLEQLPTDALAETGIQEFTTYVGSGYCVLEFALAEGDVQAEFSRFLNDPRVHAFAQKLSECLVDGQQIARTFTPADRFHAGGSRPLAGELTTAQMPLAAEASRWERSGGYERPAGRAHSQREPRQEATEGR